MSSIITGFSDAVYQKMGNESMRLAKKKSNYPKQVRIIGGQWGGRRISVLDLPDLRPTPDRVRETVFNWLQSEIIGARVLDVFAGTGVLGFESASRGARAVTSIEFNEAAFQQLRQVKTELACDQVQLIQGDALRVLKNINQVFDIIFLDPPFSKNYLYAMLDLVHQNQLLSENGLIYVETGAALDVEKVKEFLRVSKTKKTGQIYYYLLEKNHE